MLLDNAALFGDQDVKVCSKLALCHILPTVLCSLEDAVSWLPLVVSVTVFTRAGLYMVITAFRITSAEDRVGSVPYLIEKIGKAGTAMQSQPNVMELIQFP